MDLDEEEGIVAAQRHTEHVQKWFSELETLESVDPAPYSGSTPVPPEEDNDAVSGVISVQPVPQAGPSDAHEASVTVSGDVRPSSQGMVRTSRHTMRIDNEGSEFDSDFDDEFNVDEFVVSVGVE